MTTHPPASKNPVGSTDECIILDDYIIVGQDVNGADGQLTADDLGTCDDDSYDHCQDVFSDDEEVDETESLYSESVETQEQLILTVPSGLMKDLDEAHAAAELARIQEPDLVDEAVEPFSSKVAGAEVIAGQTPETEQVSECEKPTEPESTAAQTASRKNKASSPALQVSTNCTLSRASNKKRRKKLKLLKKAQAAASANQALSTKNLANTPVSKTKVKANVKKLPVPTRGSSRKVANVAVACARQTMATYRKEMRYASITKQACS